jgi:hypothetical protein
MRAGLIVISLKVPLAKDDEMVEAIPPDGPDEPFRTSVLPR